MKLKLGQNQNKFVLFIHSFSVDLLQDMEIVISIIIQEKQNSSIQYIHTKFVRNFYQYV
jgi:hypothetical protein